VKQSKVLKGVLSKDCSEKDYECPICRVVTELCVKNMCGHYICMNCEENATEKGKNACDGCLAMFDIKCKPYEPNCDSDAPLQDTENSKVVKVLFGNYLEPIINPSGVFKNQKLKNP
jgi:hypothetical protein